MSLKMKYKDLRKNKLLLNAFYNLLTKKRISIIPFYFIKEGSRNGKLPKVKTSLSPCETIILKSSDYREIAARRDRDLAEEEMLEMMKNGLVCMGIRHEDKIVAYGWYEIGHLSSPFFSIPLKENEAYLSGARTLNSYKGKNLAAYLRYQMYEHLAEQGIHTFYSLTKYSNVSSLRFKQKLGAQILKLYVFVRLTNRFQRCILLKSYRTKNSKMK
jgi:Acetyltransferase (GNAT) family